MKNIRFLKASCTGVLLLHLTAAPLLAEEVRIGHPSLSLTHWPIWIGHDAGIYKRNNLGTQVVLIGGGPTLMAALLSSELQFVSVAAVTSVVTAASGAPIKLVLSLESKMVYQIWALPEIQEVKDLKGRPISPSGPGTEPHYALSLVLKKAGLNPARDVKQLPIRGSQNRIAALLSRQVHATVLNPPFTSAARRAGLRLLADTRDLDVQHQGIAIATLESLINTHPNLVRRFTNATLEAADLMRKDKQTAIRVGVKYSKRPMDEVEDAYELLMPAVSVSGRVNVDGLRSVLEFAAEHGAAKPALDPAQFVDKRFAR